jgi:hypothetical protein
MNLSHFPSVGAVHVTSLQNELHRIKFAFLKLDFSHLEEEGQGIEEWGERNKVHLTPEKLCLLYQNPLRQS